MKWLLAFVLASSCIVPACAFTDEPANVADWQTLLKRMETLERRVDSLQQANVPVTSQAPAPAKTKPVLEVHSETWCGPCQVFKSDLLAAGEVPVEIRYIRFSNRVPAFRWTSADGRKVVKTGYQRGSLQTLLTQVVAAATPKE